MTTIIRKLDKPAVLAVFLFVLIGSLLALRPTQAVLGNGAEAEGLLGQHTSSGTGLAPYYDGSEINGAPNGLGLYRPTDVELDVANQRLYVVDGFHNRVLVYATDTDGVPLDFYPDYVLGQSSFNTAVHAAGATGLGHPHGAAIDSSGNRLFVADSDNDRVLVYDVSAITNGEAAVNVLGQADFSGSTGSLSQTRLDVPFGVDYDAVNDRLFVVDGHNARVMVYDVASITDGEAAVNVLGQSDFTTETTGLSASKFNGLIYTAYDSANDGLYVADSSNNRVLYFDTASISDGEAAVNVLGQPNFTSNASGLTASTMNWPRGISLDTANDRLFVSDNSNDRVLVYDVSTITNGEAAANVLGQSDFTTGTSGLTASKFDFPHGLVYNPTADQLVLAVYNQHRIMFFDTATITDGEAAVNLIGQPDGNSASWAQSYTLGIGGNVPNGLGHNWPAGLALDEANNRLFVADKASARILVYGLDADHTPTDLIPENVLGQPDFHTTTAVATATGLRAPMALAYDSGNSRLFAADSTNNRVLVYDVAAITDGEAAVNVLGQSNFTSAGAATTQGGLSYTFGVDYEATTQQLCVAERNNNRVLIYDLSSGITDGMNASYVLGQSNFTSSGTALTQSGMNQPHYCQFDSANKRLYVSDRANHRVLVFDYTGGFSNGMNASYVLGQPDFTTNSISADAAHLSSPLGIAVDGSHDRLFVTATGQDRVLVFDTAAGLSNGPDAVNVIGQPDFTSTASTTSRSSMQTPYMLSLDSSGDRVYVSDHNSGSRVLYFDTSVNPTPTVSTLDPDNKVVNSAEFTLTVNGTGFVSGSTVRWDSADLATTYVSGTQLTATVPAGNLTSASTVPVTVYNPAPGGGESASVDFRVWVGSGSSAKICQNPAITLSRPNGGEQFAAGENVYILWGAEGCGLTGVELSYSTDSGQTYPHAIAQAGDATSGFYEWTVPAGIDSATVRVKAVLLAAGGPVTSDASEADLTLGDPATADSTVDDLEAEAEQTTACPVPAGFPYTYGTPLAADGEPWIYLFAESGCKRLIVSPEVYFLNFTSWAEVVRIEKLLLDSLVQGDDLTGKWQPPVEPNFEEEVAAEPPAPAEGEAGQEESVDQPVDFALVPEAIDVEQHQARLTESVAVATELFGPESLEPVPPQPELGEPLPPMPLRPGDIPEPQVAPPPPEQVAAIGQAVSDYGTATQQFQEGSRAILGQVDDQAAIQEDLRSVDSVVDSSVDLVDYATRNQLRQTEAAVVDGLVDDEAAQAAMAEAQAALDQVAQAEAAWKEGQAQLDQVMEQAIQETKQSQAVDQEAVLLQEMMVIYTSQLAEKRVELARKLSSLDQLLDQKADLEDALAEQVSAGQAVAGAIAATESRQANLISAEAALTATRSSKEQDLAWVNDRISQLESGQAALQADQQHWQDTYQHWKSVDGRTRQQIAEQNDLIGQLNSQINRLPAWEWWNRAPLENVRNQAQTEVQSLWAKVVEADGNWRWSEQQLAGINARLAEVTAELPGRLNDRAGVTAELASLDDRLADTARQLSLADTELATLQAELSVEQQQQVGTREDLRGTARAIAQTEHLARLLTIEIDNLAATLADVSGIMRNKWFQAEVQRQTAAALLESVAQQAEANQVAQSGLAEAVGVSALAGQVLADLTAPAVSEPSGSDSQDSNLIAVLKGQSDEAAALVDDCSAYLLESGLSAAAGYQESIDVFGSIEACAGLGDIVGGATDKAKLISQMLLGEDNAVSGAIDRVEQYSAGLYDAAVDNADDLFVGAFVAAQTGDLSLLGAAAGDTVNDMVTYAADTILVDAGVAALQTAELVMSDPGQAAQLAGMAVTDTFETASHNVLEAAAQSIIESGLYGWLQGW
jgi:DNA-binding beta-propeller fold protein YncE